jgi:hypothetical protein
VSGSRLAGVGQYPRLTMVREELERPGASGEGSRKTGSPSGGDAATARMRWNEYLHSITRSRPGASGESYSEVLVRSS